MNKGRDLSPKMKKLLLEIPVYPEWKSCRTSGFPVDAPLCEEYNKVCYISQKAKDVFARDFLGEI